MGFASNTFKNGTFRTIIAFSVINDLISDQYCGMSPAFTPDTFGFRNVGITFRKLPAHDIFDAVYLWVAAFRDAADAVWSERAYQHLKLCHFFASILFQ